MQSNHRDPVGKAIIRRALRTDRFSGTKPAGGPPEVTPRMHLLIRYMVHGCEHRHLVEPWGYPLNTPLTVDQAADVVRFRRRQARELITYPIVSKALAKANADLRTGAHTKAIHRMIAIVDEPGEGKASDRKVQLEAARSVLGEDQAGALNPRVSVSIHNTVQTPGYVINVHPDTTPPDRPAATIDASPDDRTGHQ